MRIAVNTRLLIKNKLDGIGRYSFEVLKRIVESHPDIEFHFIFDRPYSTDFIFSKNIKPHVLRPSTRHPFLWYFWFEVQLPRLINKIKPNIFFSPDGFMSTKLKHIPTIITIHDINFEHRPKDLNWLHSIYYRKYFRQYAKESKHIITVSKFSKKDIIKNYHVSSDKITVAYNGVGSNFIPLERTKQKIIKKKYSDNKDFFLFIGSLHKRKNIKNLLSAFDIYQSKNGKNKLLIIGKKKWWDRQTENIYQNMRFKEKVIFLGQINDELMVDILGSSKALCFVSLFEGFGLPIIEAMKCNVPVITSNTSAMPEIAGNAALIVNPNDVNEISDAMSQIDNDSKLSKKLILKGQKKIHKFKWDITANVIYQVLLKYAN
ncbi:MAG: glycosyltransferase family 1 protein [Flavobacteriales bacterium TMED191]|nr:MAG: glycosyltransferase family 1 protein [Flavobacteriales bacterium TMED191]